MRTEELLITALPSAAAVLLYEYADRRVGAGGERVLGPLGGRTVGFLAGGLGGAALGYIAAGPWAASLGLFWAVYRSLNFKHGAAAPVNNRERRNAVLRHLLAVLAAGPVYLLGGPWILTAVVMVAYANVAAWLAFGLGQMLIQCQRTGTPWNDEWNAVVERSRGFAYGIAFAVICIGGWVLS